MRRRFSAEDAELTAQVRGRRSPDVEPDGQLPAEEGCDGPQRSEAEEALQVLRLVQELLALSSRRKDCSMESSGSWRRRKTAAAQVPEALPVVRGGAQTDRADLRRAVRVCTRRSRLLAAAGPRRHEPVGAAAGAGFEVPSPFVSQIRKAA